MGVIPILPSVLIQATVRCHKDKAKEIILIQLYYTQSVENSCSVNFGVKMKLSTEC